MSQTEQNDSAQAENYVTTDHDRVFYKTENDSLYSRGEFEVAEAVADAFPEYTVVITMGPFRFGHSLFWDLNNDAKEVHLDFYSVRPLDGYTPEILVEDLRAEMLGRSEVQSFESVIDLLDRVAEPEDSGWGVRFALQGDEHTLEDGTSVWVGAPDEIDDTYVHVGLRDRWGSYKLTLGAEDSLRDALEE